jgi:hypothetical protein
MAGARIPACWPLNFSIGNPMPIKSPAALERASLLATAKLKNVEPFAYLKGILERWSTITR